MWKGGCWESRLVLSSGGSHFSHMFGKTKICYQLSFSGKIHFHWYTKYRYFSPLFDTPQHFLRSDYGPWLEEWILGILTLFPFILPKVSHISFINWFCILSVSLIQPSLSSRPGVEHKTEALWPDRLLPKQDGRTADAGWRCIVLVDFNIDSIARDVSLKMLCLIREKQRAGDWRTLCGQGELGTITWILNLQSWRNWNQWLWGVFQMRMTTLLLETKFSIKTFRSCAVQGGTDCVALVRSCWGETSVL